MAGNFPSSAKDPSARTGYILVKLLKTKDKGKHLFLSEKKKTRRMCHTYTQRKFSQQKRNDERRGLRISGRKKAHSKQNMVEHNNLSFSCAVFSLV